METKHIKLNYDEAIFGKKQLLHSEVDILNLLKRFKNYRLLRKKENLTRNKLKSTLTSLRAKTSVLLGSFPKEESEKIKINRPKFRKIGQSKQNKIHEELAEIQRKLEKLG